MGNSSGKAGGALGGVAGAVICAGLLGWCVSGWAAATNLAGQGTNAITGEEDIRGIKEPVVIPSSWGWLWWLLAVAVIAALAFYAWRKWGRRVAAPKPAVLVPPHRRAKDRLRAAHELLSDPYRFCSLVSDVVRIYLEERFDLHAPERTTEEFLEEMRGSAALSTEQKGMLEEFLTQCDLVKFARAEPSETELNALLEAALRLIDETSVTAEEAVAGQPAEEARA